MTFQEWHTQQSGHLFAIVDTALDTSAVKDYYSFGGINAIPLFTGTGFADQAAQGPWLLSNPSPGFVTAHPELGGIYVASTASFHVVLQHWQSLIEVAFEGEVMWLRYADNRIFPAILTALSPQELDDILGPCSSLWANDRVWQHTAEAEFIPRQGPWFRLQPHHLASLYDENLHAYTLSRHFWQRLEEIMVRHPEPEIAITHVLKQAKQTKLDDDVLEGVVAGVLALQTGMPLAGISAPLMLTDSDMAQVNNELNKHPEWTGII